VGSAAGSIDVGRSLPDTRSGEMLIGAPPGSTTSHTATPLANRAAAASQSARREGAGATRRRSDEDACS
jgi:hypothetical protein